MLMPRFQAVMGDSVVGVVGVVGDEVFCRAIQAVVVVALASAESMIALAKVCLCSCSCSCLCQKRDTAPRLGKVGVPFGGWGWGCPCGMFSPLSLPSRSRLPYITNLEST